MLLLQAQDISKLFGSDTLFEHLDMQIESNAKIGLVGKNGVGKSTFLKIIAGVEAASSGEIITKKNLTMSYLDQNSGLKSSLTVFEELLSVFQDLIAEAAILKKLEKKMGEAADSTLDEIMIEYDNRSAAFASNGGYSYETEVKAVLNGFNFPESSYNKKISELSGGQRTRLALAKTLLSKPELLILDEPTNHLDIQTLSWLENYLKNYKQALLIVSHDRYFLDKTTNLTYEIAKRTMKRYVGNYSSFLTQKAQNYQSEIKSFNKQQKEIAKLEQFVEKNITRASTTKRAQSKRKQLEKITVLDTPMLDNKSIHFSFQIDKPSGNVVLTTEQLAIGYDHQNIAQNITFEERRKERFVIVGPNGIGKSTLLKTIIGAIPAKAGSYKLGANVSIGYYDQIQERLTKNKTVLNELWDDFSTTPEKEIRSRLGAFLFSGDDVKKTVGDLSGGERARLLLAKLSMENHNFLVLDEPTNHLDIDSKEVLEQSLTNFEGTILFVSHDRYFINQIATQVIELNPNGAKQYLGNYDYYLEKKAEADNTATAAKSTSKQADAPPNSINKEKQREQRRLKRLIEALELEMEELDLQISAIHQELLKPEFAQNFEKLHQLNMTLEEKENAQTKVMSDWEKLSLELEAF
ncbi:MULTISPECIES: ribosomal protection-like ABC-F family protein [unclassified Enterococcus]|uniref:ribosomal protection-like ABC-F family protein n=1 Tax=unclassified Enterococcus TaxID=2608891 RepID=UPI001551F6B1|nr:MULTISPECIES: ABC-F family ATP-binding cassette domain-containing protein [unclassified Enterococcus]MBS7577519.1 ABC-F family ATP-binding cassette domain-containing protein [Enterococcus sp. MMGLQ5-2]MBS7584982.1 ABC-F family ATP-binding cassette domain-containing protein [Enterococcus sp. MMGLQ5-1]NPD12837.1 ABC-F family ATP-binding cassette domain-containing protein [Enterococcus sp. MMGLQ5-1]NPD37352.1 ABC-F family ATP-binding cassette domain-containing protein [Enterococcus sp. MMGLQ5-2